MNPVLSIPFAPAAAAEAHFAARLTFETDCSDVAQALATGTPDFVLLDARRPQASQRHVPGAVSLPHATMTAERMAVYPDSTLFVVYCAGPHCNAADQAALRLARLGRPVKIMLGGITGWADEGLALADGPAPASAGPVRMDAADACGCS